MQKERGIRFKHSRLVILLSICLIAVDQISKQLIRVNFALNKPVPVVDGILWITHVENSGVAFGMAKGFSLVLSAAGFVLLIILLSFYSDFLSRGTGAVSVPFIFAGAISNMIDRVAKGTVTDFIDLGFWPVFNLADSFIVIGVVLMLVSFLKYGYREGADASGSG